MRSAFTTLSRDYRAEMRKHALAWKQLRGATSGMAIEASVILLHAAIECRATAAWAERMAR